MKGIREDEWRGNSPLTLGRSRLNWDWRREDPVELILLVFILVVFFLFPREGCGVSSEAEVANQPNAAAAPVVVVEPGS